MNKKIIEIVKEYIDNKNDNSAIMINGDWGSGKTFFVKNILCTEIDNALYIPLYGVANIDELSERICFEVLKKGTLKKLSRKAHIKENKNSVKRPVFNMIKNFLNPVLKKWLGVDLDSIDKKDFKEIISQSTMLDNYVLVFDDLERCNVDIDIIMGFINDLVEHKKVKTIIVANENEIIGKNDANDELKLMSVLNDKIDFPAFNKNENSVYGSYNNNQIENNKISKKEIKERVGYLYKNNEKYKKTKEKLISNTIDYIPDLDVVIESYKENYSSEVSKYMNDDTIKNTMNKYNCNNLRTLKVALNKFEQIYLNSNGYISKNYKKDIDDLYERILVNTIAVTIAQKNGDYIPKILDGVLYSCTSIEKGFLNISSSIDMFAFVNDFISSSYFDDDLMKRGLEYYFDLRTNGYGAEDPMNIVDYYWEYESVDIKNALTEIRNNINDYNYKNYPRMISKFAALLSIDFESDLINEIIDAMKENIKNIEIDYIDFDSLISESEVRKKYDDIVSDFEKLIKNTKDTIYKNKIDSILESEEWGTEIYEYVRECDQKGIFTSENGFLAKFNVNKIIDNIKKSNNKNIHEFRRAINSVYRFRNINEYYKADIENLRILIDALDEMNDEKDLIRKMAIEYLNKNLKEKLALIEQ